MRKKIGSIVMLGMLLFNNIYAQIAYSVDLYDFDETQIENTDSENPVSNGDLPGGGGFL